MSFVHHVVATTLDISQVTRSTLYIVATNTGNFSLGHIIFDRVSIKCAPGEQVVERMVLQIRSAQKVPTLGKK